MRILLYLFSVLLCIISCTKKKDQPISGREISEEEYKVKAFSLPYEKFIAGRVQYTFTNMVFSNFSDYWSNFSLQYTNAYISAVIANARGVEAARRSGFSDALTHFRTAENHISNYYIDIHRADIYNNIGGMYHVLNNFKSALEYYSRAAKELEILKGSETNTSLRFEYDLKIIRRNLSLANCFASAGSSQEAENAYAHTEELCRTDEDNYSDNADASRALHELKADCAFSRAQFYYKTEQAAAAQTQLSNAQNWYGVSGSVSRQHLVSLITAVINFNTSAASVYEATALRAAEYFENCQDFENAFTSWYYLGYFQQKSEKKDDAINSFVKAMELSESMYEQLSARELKAVFFNEMHNPYSLLITLLAENGRHFEALEWYERSKCRDLREVLLRSPYGFSGVFPSPYKEQISSLMEELNTSSTRLHTAYNPTEVSALKKKIASLRTTIGKASEEAELHNPVIRQLSSRMHLREVLDEIPEDTVVLEYKIISPNRLYLWISTRNKTELKIVNTLHNIVSVISRYSAWCAAPEYTVSKDTSQSGPGNILYSLLFAPAENHIKNKKHILIIPSDELFTISFEAIPGKDRGREEYMIDRDQIITYCNSLFVWHLLHLRTPVKYRAPFLGFGDPDFYGMLSQLPGAKKETMKAAEQFTGGEAFYGKDATEDLFKELTRTKNYRFIHIATHGDLTPLREPLIYFSLKPGGREDGYLKADEVFSLSVKSELVVISACQTALGTIERGEGLVGFARSFYFAGTDGLIISQWNVPDAQTADIFISFYSQISSDSALPSVALRRSKREIRGKYPHPFYWGAFIFLGKHRNPVLFK